MSPPPGYTAYGDGNVGAYGSFAPIGGLAKALRVLIIILIPVLVIAALMYVSLKGTADDFVNGDVDSGEYADALAPYGLISILSGALQLALFVLTIIWMFRMAKNAVQLRRSGTWGPGWAIAGWFLPPCVLYVIPYLMMRDLWKSSDPESGPDWKRNTVGMIVHVWWVLFGLAPLAFISVTIGNFRLNQDGDNRDTAEDLVDGFATTLGAAAIQIAAAVAFLLLVTQLSARHKRTINEG